ncbi:MAG: FKBP-type peptidyl-prolyl cis-trans isomerase [Motiliproteus sp.]
MTIFKSARWLCLGMLTSVVLILPGCDNELLSRLDDLEAKAAVNAKIGTEFLAANASQSGVVSTASGLQYKVLQPGSGTTATLSDRVTVHYRGTLIDGSEFDSSIARGKPATFPVAGLIEGWQEALQLMRQGDRWQLYIPAELAYGKRSPSTDIPPSSTLLFEMELLQIEQSPEQEAN